MTWPAALTNFRAYLLLERSLSPNTLDAYLNDVRKFVRFLEIEQRDLLPLAVRPVDLHAGRTVGEGRRCKSLTSWRTFGRCGTSLPSDMTVMHGPYPARWPSSRGQRAGRLFDSRRAHRSLRAP